MKLKVVYSQWGADGFDEPLGGGQHDLEDVTEEQARSIAGAAATGVVEVLDATAAEKKLLEGHVQSQEDGEAAFDAAQGEWVEAVLDDAGALKEPGYWSGAWTHGHLSNFMAEQKNRLTHDDAARTGNAPVSKKLSDEERAEAERQIGFAERTLAKVGVPE